MSWDLSKLETLLADRKDLAVTREESCLCITNEDGLESYLAVSGEQIIVEALLFGVDQVAEAAALNDEILRTHQLFPLTTVGITTVDNTNYYMAFGALSSQSKEGSVLIEIDMLFQNVAGFLDAYQDYLK